MYIRSIGCCSSASPVGSWWLCCSWKGVQRMGKLLWRQRGSNTWNVVAGMIKVAASANILLWQSFFNYSQAYDDEDPDLARQALASPFIKHMDVEYARLARDLQLPKGISTAPKANVIENATASYKSPNTAGSSNDVSNIRWSAFKKFLPPHMFER